MSTHEVFEDRLLDLIEQTALLDPTSEEFATAAKNTRLFSEIPIPEFPPAPDPDANQRWSRFKTGAAKIWDNETTRVFIKAGGAFAGVGLVVYTTIRQDHVLERNAIAQANQSPK